MLDCTNYIMLSFEIHELVKGIVIRHLSCQCSTALRTSRASRREQLIMRNLYISRAVLVHMHLDTGDAICTVVWRTWSISVFVMAKYNVM